MKPTMTIREASRRMGVSEQTLRVSIQQGLYSWGVATKVATKFQYIINRKGFEKEWSNEK